MHPKNFLSIAIASLLIGPAFADLAGSSLQPSFSKEEQIIIDRNSSLLELSKSNPWIVRRILDALEAVTSGDGDNRPPPQPSNDAPQDPDFDRMQRASPEAVHDLFQLLKQAGKKETK